MSFFTVDRDVLSHLTATAAVEAFHDLLVATAHRHGLAVTQVSVSFDVNVADGGGLQAPTFVDYVTKHERG